MCYSSRGVCLRAAFEKAPPEVQEILGKPIRDLGLKLEGSPLERFVQQLYRELDRKGLKKFRPACYLTDEWGCPSGEPIIGIPFYLADPKLARLEKEMNDLEDSRQIMMYLRHEAGHALNYAYALHKTPEWKQIFGPYRKPYRDAYRPIPFSRNFVRHMEGWYAQKHPDEDFAETFAVWLTPSSRWRERYKGWPALRKLEYIDALMEELAGTRPANRTRTKVEPLSALRMTLREHYRRKREKYDFNWPAVYDRDLRRIFSDDPKHSTRPSAASFIRSVRREVRQIVAEGTGVHQYTIDHVLENMIDRCKELKLRVSTPA